MQLFKHSCLLLVAVLFCFVYLSNATISDEETTTEFVKPLLKRRNAFYMQPWTLRSESGSENSDFLENEEVFEKPKLKRRNAFFIEPKTLDDSRTPFNSPAISEAESEAESEQPQTQAPFTRPALIRRNAFLIQAANLPRNPNNTPLEGEFNFNQEINLEAVDDRLNHIRSKRHVFAAPLSVRLQQKVREHLDQQDKALNNENLRAAAVGPFFAVDQPTTPPSTGLKRLINSLRSYAGLNKNNKDNDINNNNNSDNNSDNVPKVESPILKQVKEQTQEEKDRLEAKRRRNKDTDETMKYIIRTLL